MIDIISNKKKNLFSLQKKFFNTLQNINIIMNKKNKNNLFE